MNLIKRANEFFKTADYKNAYDLYKQAANKYGERIVKYNLLACEKHLGSDLPEYPRAFVGELDCATKVLLDNSKVSNLQKSEREECLKQYKSVSGKKSEDAAIKDVDLIPSDWPKDLELAPLPESTNDYDWKRSYKAKNINESSATKGLSIIVPTFNRSKILEVTLACLVNQKTDYKFEVIVADEGSKEDLSIVTRKFENKLDIKLVRQRDDGVQLCAVRNLGLRTAKYSFVSILDSEMAPNTSWVQSYMELLVEDDDIALVGPRQYVDTHGIDPQEFLINSEFIATLPEVVVNNSVVGQVITKMSVDWRLEHFKKTENLRLDDTPFKCFSGGNIAFSKKWLSIAGCFDEDIILEDGQYIEFSYRLYKKGCFFKSINKGVVYHQKNSVEGQSADNFAIQKALEDKVPYGYRKDYSFESAAIKPVPLVSIYVPAYNCENSIVKCVDSALNQTITDLEVCICDDGSTDGTLELLKRKYANNPRVRYMTQKNGGIGKASNSAVKMAKGHYIGQLDSDDYLEPDAVELCLCEFNKDSKLACVYTTNRNVNPDGSLIKNGFNWPIYSRERLVTKMMCHHFRMFTARAWNQTTGFDEKITNAVDYDMYLKLSDVGPFKHINKICYNRVLHGENTSIQQLGAQKRNHFLAINNHLKRNNINNYYFIPLTKSDACRKYEIINKAIQPGSFINNYFDNIYVVNLKDKVPNRLAVSNHLYEHGIDFEIFEATNGYAGEALEKFNKYKKRGLGELTKYPQYNARELKKGTNFIESTGAIGYIFTYLRILKDAKKKRHKRFLILEDDILLCHDFESRFEKFIDDIQDEWKILQLGASQYGWDSVDLEASKKRGYYYPRDMDTKGSFAIAFDSSIIDDLIKVQTTFEAPFDHAPMSDLYERYLTKCFVAYPYLVMPDVSESSIRGKRDQYTHAKRVKWAVDDYDFPLKKPSIAIVITSKTNLKYLSNFSSNENLPFILHLYFNSNDKLCLIDKTKMSDILDADIKPILKPIVLYGSDFIASMDEKEILTENDIVKFIEYNTGVKKVNVTAIREIESAENKKIVKKPIHKVKVNKPIPTKDIGFYRVIGNNMPGLHSNNQLLSNLSYILEHEPDFEQVEKWFVINRIIDPKEKEQLINLLNTKKVKYLDISFNYNDFKNIGYDLNNLPDSEFWFKRKTDWDVISSNTAVRVSKNRYLMNNNGARNFALRHGKKLYQWTMPWDGNCFLSDPHFRTLEKQLKDSGKYKYVATPMERLLGNESLDKNSLSNNAVEEPQISFRDDSIEHFNEERVYGNQPKVELFKRLGFPGVWDNHTNLYKWKKLEFEKSPETGLVTSSSAVFRLFSGNEATAINSGNRGRTRAKGLVDFIDEVETHYAKENLDKFEFKDAITSCLNHFIEDQRLAEINKKLLLSYEDKKRGTSERIKMLEEIGAIYKTVKNNATKVEVIKMLFVYSLLGKKDNNSIIKIVSTLNIDKTLEFVGFNTKDSRMFMNQLTSTFIALLSALMDYKMKESVALKLELVMLLYFYYSNKSSLDIKDSKSIDSIIDFSYIIFENVFEYDLTADLKRAGITDLPFKAFENKGVEEKRERVGRTIFLAQRTDGFGERLRALLNAKALADYYSSEFKFDWKLMYHGGRDMNAVASKELTFSDSFIEDYHVDVINITDQSIGRVDDYEQTLSHEDDNYFDVTQNTNLSKIPFLKQVFSEINLADVFLSIKFSEELDHAINAANHVYFDKDSIAIHLRAGDIIFGKAGYTDRYVNKVIPYTLAIMFIKMFHEQGNNIVLFGQDNEFCQFLVKEYNVTYADSLCPKSYTKEQRCLFDIVLMSKCTKVIAGSSGFSILACNIGNIKRSDPKSILSKKESVLSTIKMLKETSDDVKKHYKQISFTCNWAISNGRDFIEDKDFNFLVNLGFENDPSNYLFVFLKAIYFFKINDIEQVELILHEYLSSSVHCKELINVIEKPYGLEGNMSTAVTPYEDILLQYTNCDVPIASLILAISKSKIKNSQALAANYAEFYLKNKKQKYEYIDKIIENILKNNKEKVLI
jgi:chondroitin synthase